VQVKICPKCKAENKLSNASCSKCYASLEGALSSEVPDPVVPEAQQDTQSAQPQIGSAPPAPTIGAAPGMPTVGGPPPAEGPPPATGANPYGPPPSAVYTPPMRENSRPIRQGPDVGAIVLLIVLLAGAGFGAWWFFLKPKGPEQVVSAFMEATKSGDLEKMKTCLASSSRKLFEMPGVAEGFKRGFEYAKSHGGNPDDKQYKYGPTTFEGDSKAVVQVSESKSDGSAAGETQDMVLVKEEGKWGIDFQETMTRALAKKGITMPQGASPFGR
jgi:hypothetical protein